MGGTVTRSVEVRWAFEVRYRQHRRGAPVITHNDSISVPTSAEARTYMLRFISEMPDDARVIDRRVYRLAAKSTHTALTSIEG
jgi:hypothetical protein